MTVIRQAVPSVNQNRNRGLAFSFPSDVCVAKQLDINAIEQKLSGGLLMNRA
jgi:hypothetical protein